MIVSYFLTCLALNIYFEARNQPVMGQIGVSMVVLNRVNSTDYPDNVCDVIYQGKHSKITGMPLRHKCQFSWYCDGLTDTPKDVDAYRWAEIIAKDVWDHKGKSDITNGSLFYHSMSVRPKWADKKTFVKRIGDHLFYR